MNNATRALLNMIGDSNALEYSELDAHLDATGSKLGLAALTSFEERIKSCDSESEYFTIAKELKELHDNLPYDSKLLDYLIKLNSDRIDLLRRKSKKSNKKTKLTNQLSMFNDYEPIKKTSHIEGKYKNGLYVKNGESLSKGEISINRNFETEMNKIATVGFENAKSQYNFMLDSVFSRAVKGYAKKEREKFFKREVNFLGMGICMQNNLNSVIYAEILNYYSEKQSNLINNLNK